MPTVRDVTKKFEEFLSDLRQSRQALHHQNSAYKRDIKALSESTGSVLTALLSGPEGFDPHKIRQMQDVLGASGSELNINHAGQEMRELSAERMRQLVEIERLYGSPAAAASKIAEAQTAYYKSLDEFRTLNEKHIYGLSYEFRHVTAFNRSAERSRKTPVTPDNAEQFRHSPWKRLKDDFLAVFDLLGTEDVDKAILSRHIRKYSPEVFASKLQRYEDEKAVISNMEQALDESNLEIGRLQGVEDARRDLSNSVLDERGIERQLAELLIEELGTNQTLRSNFAETYGEAGRALLLQCAQSVILQRLRHGIQTQIGKLDDTIQQIETPLEKIRKKSAHSTVRIDLQAIEQQIRNGKAGLDIYQEKADEYRNDVQRYRPSPDQDSSLLPNFIILHMMLSSETPVGNTLTNPGMHGGGDKSTLLRHDFASSLPDVTALDIANLDLDKIITGGLDIGGLNADIVPDIGSSLSGLSGGVDSGGGLSYDGGSSSSFSADSGGF